MTGRPVCADCCGCVVWCLLPLRHWRHGVESHSGHKCTFICLCFCCLCGQRPCEWSISHVKKGSSSSLAFRSIFVPWPPRSPSSNRLCSFLQIRGSDILGHFSGTCEVPFRGKRYISATHCRSAPHCSTCWGT